MVLSGDGAAATFHVRVVLDGYEYRPNIEVLGYVDLGKSNVGGTTKAPYGLAPDGRY